MNNALQLTDDETLSAYLDGELADADAARVRDRLAAEPALRQRLDALRAADSGARRALADIDREPLPQAVLDLLAVADDQPQRTAPAGAGKVLPFPARAVRPFLQLPVAIAAAVALAAGFFASRQLDTASMSTGDGARYPGIVTAGTDLYRLFETGVSSAPVALADHTQGAVVLTFEDRNGRYCRQVRVSGADATSQAVACRQAGNWQLQTLAFGAPAAPAADGQYRPAAAQTVPAVDAAIEALIGDRPPLDASAESALVTSGWKNNGSLRE